MVQVPLHVLLGIKNYSAYGSLVPLRAYVACEEPGDCTTPNDKLAQGSSGSNYLHKQRDWSLGHEPDCVPLVFV